MCNLHFPSPFSHTVVYLAEEVGRYHVSVNAVLHDVHTRSMKNTEVVRYLAHHITFEGTVAYTLSKILACECGTVMRKDSA